MKYFAFLLLSAMVVDQPTLPRLLEKALGGLPGIRLLDPSVDLVGGYTLNEIKEFGYWPPWVVTDVDRDGRPGHELGVFASPSRDSKFLFPVTACTQATVRRVAGSEQERWYFVETRGRQRVRGWIPASFAAESECIG